MTLPTPDNGHFYKENAKSSLPLFISGGANVLGFHMEHLMAVENITTEARAQRKIKAIPERAYVAMPFEGFVGQKVICFRGEWISRKSVIKYLANKCSVAHSKKLDTASDRKLAHIRASCHISLDDTGKGVRLDLFSMGIDSNSTEIDHRSGYIDLVLAEALAAATHIANSPRVAELEQYVQTEVHS